jgi:tyrosinase
MAERTNYTDAVNCLRKLPPITSLDYAPGVRNRFDDFHVNHINATVFVHNSVCQNIPPRF